MKTCHQFCMFTETGFFSGYYLLQPLALISTAQKKCSALTLKALHRLQLSSGSECCRASKCKMSTQFIIFSRLSSTEKYFANLYGLIITDNLLKPLLYGWVRESYEMEDHMYRNLYSDDDLQSLVLIAGSHFL